MIFYYRSLTINNKKKKIIKNITQKKQLNFGLGGGGTPW